MLIVFRNDLRIVALAGTRCRVPFTPEERCGGGVGDGDDALLRALCVETAVEDGAVVLDGGSEKMLLRVTGPSRVEGNLSEEELNVGPVSCQRCGCDWLHG